MVTTNSFEADPSIRFFGNQIPLTGGYPKVTEWTGHQIEEAAMYLDSLISHIRPQLKYLVLKEVSEHYGWSGKEYREYAKRTPRQTPGRAHRGLWVGEMRISDRFVADLFITREATWVVVMKSQTNPPNRLEPVNSGDLFKMFAEFHFDLRDLIQLIKEGVAEALKTKAAEHYTRAAELYANYDFLQKQ